MHRHEEEAEVDDHTARDVNGPSILPGSRDRRNEHPPLSGA